jgi:TonB-linked SusC/RagA family outer membrane protein
MKKRLLMLLMVLTSAMVVVAQSTVTGRVTSAATGGPAEGISVSVKGSRTGTITNANGIFSIQANKGDVLTFSGVGFATKDITVGDGAVDVALATTVGDLGEVVVVGYGTQKKANLTGSVTQLNNAALIKRQVSSSTQVLQGLAPGLTVQQQSGRPGADGASLRIRGNASLAGVNDPLVIIDGLQLQTGIDGLNNLDPNAIESITVLKDAASAAIYGNRASAGVIIVKTKRPQRKGIQVSYNNFITKQEFTSIPERVDALDHMLLSNVANKNLNPTNPDVFPQSQIDLYRTKAANNFDVINTNWLDEILTNNGLMHNHNVQLMSGGEKVNVFASFTYFNQQGLIQNNSFRKYDIRFNPEFKLNDKLTLTGVLAYNTNRTINPSSGSPEFIIRQAIGLPAIGGGKYGPGQYGTAAQSNNRNPIAMAEATGTSQTEGNTMLTRFGFNYHPIKGLELEGYWGREKRNPYTKSFLYNADIYAPNLSTSKYDKIAVWPNNTQLNETWRNDIYRIFNGQATYSFRVKQDHSIKVLAGAQNELFTNFFFGGSRNGFINTTAPFLNLGSTNRDNNSGASELALVGFYGRINYGFKDKYLLELNGRRDGSSRFSASRDKQWGTFGSASAGWIFSKENFFNKISDVVTFGKLRLSYGGNGNQGIGSNYVFDAFYGQSNYSNPNNGTNAYFNSLSTLGVAILQFPNPELQWETAKQFNIGLDLTLLNKISITADYYERTSKDMILQRPLPSSAGSLANPFVNAGNMVNKGWEFSVNYRTRINKLNIDVTGMLSDVKNEVTRLVDGVPFLDGGSLRTYVGSAFNSYYGLQAVGFYADSNDVKASPTLYGTGWNVSPTVGPKPGDIKYADISGPDGKPDGVVNDLDRTVIGNAFPRYEYSINLNLSYKGFDLNIFGQGVGKRNNFLSGTGAVPFLATDFIPSLLGIHKDYWTPENQSADFPRLLASGGSYTNNFRASSWWIRSAAYFRLKNINLGYTLPEKLTKKAHISNVRVFVSGQNLFTISKAWKGFDPEINNANAEFYPVMRTYTAGINVTF